MKNRFIYNFTADEESKKVTILNEGRKIYEIYCINFCHFYVVIFMARKLCSGEKVNMSFFNPVKEE